MLNRRMFLLTLFAPASVARAEVIFVKSEPAKKHASVIFVQSQKWDYPLRGNLWTGCDSWTHMTTGHHAGKFDVGWLKTLTNDELQSLHSDDHQNKVHWDHVERLERRTAATKAVEIPCPT